MKYKVLREHMGDKDYLEGDIRDVTNKGDAKHLLDRGLIAEIDDDDEADSKAKAATKAKNKAAPAPKNKAEPAPKNKSE